MLGTGDHEVRVRGQGLGVRVRGQGSGVRVRG